MKRIVIDKIKSLCNEEVKFSYKSNFITLLFPYSNAEIEIEIEGDNEEELIEDFIEKVNQQIDDMIDHLGDCKL